MPVVAAATARLRSAGEVPAGAERATTTAAGAAVAPTCGHPRNATTALASTNIIAAPASSEPAVPNPAMYALVARIPQRFYRQPTENL